MTHVVAAFACRYSSVRRRSGPCTSSTVPRGTITTMRRARAGRLACVMAVVATIGAVFVPGAGARAASRDPRYSASIVNGNDASLDQWAYIVALLARSEPSTYYAQ